MFKVEDTKKSVKIPALEYAVHLGPKKVVEISHLDTRVSEHGQLYILVETTRTTHIKRGI